MRSSCGRAGRSLSRGGGDARRAGEDGDLLAPDEEYGEAERERERDTDLEPADADLPRPRGALAAAAAAAADFESPAAGDRVRRGAAGDGERELDSELDDE